MLGGLYTVILESEGQNNEHFHIQVRKNLWRDTQIATDIMGNHGQELLDSSSEAFGRAFVGGGIAQVAVVWFATGGLRLGSLQSWLVMLAVSFVTGGLLALDKLLRYVPANTTQRVKQ
jgi:hypothetical protein